MSWMCIGNGAGGVVRILLRCRRPSASVHEFADLAVGAVTELVARRCREGGGGLCRGCGFVENDGRDAEADSYGTCGSGQRDEQGPN